MLDALLFMLGATGRLILLLVKGTISWIHFLFVWSPLGGPPVMGGVEGAADQGVPPARAPCFSRSLGGFIPRSSVQYKHRKNSRQLGRIRRAAVNWCRWVRVPDETASPVGIFAAVFRRRHSAVVTTLGLVSHLPASTVLTPFFTRGRRSRKTALALLICVLPASTNKEGQPG